MNFFEILEIEPTLDKEKIKKAFKKRLLDVHPDKGGDTDVCRQVIEAWNYLSQPDKLAKYYEEFSQGKPSADLSDERKFPHTTSPAKDFTSDLSDAVIKFNEKVTVFIPVFIPSTRYSYWESIDAGTEYNPSDIKLADIMGGFRINPFRLTKDANFEVIAEILTKNFKHRDSFFTFVGLDTEEAEKIINMHDRWRKSCVGHFFIETKVSAANLYPRASEKDFHPTGVLNIKEGNYFSIKQNTVIASEDIIGFHKGYFDDFSYPIAGLPKIPGHVENPRCTSLPKKLIAVTDAPRQEESKKVTPAIEYTSAPKTTLETQAPKSVKQSEKTNTSFIASIGVGVVSLGIFALKHLLGKNSVEAAKVSRPNRPL